MSLQDDLKTRTRDLISQQMANWVVDIQNRIRDQQAGLVEALDRLGEEVARFDEKINESDIEMAVAEVMASAPAAGPVGPGFDRLKAAIAEIDRGNNLSEVLTYLVNEVSHHIERAAMFIVKGPNAIGWYARGVNPADAIKHVNLPLTADTVFAAVNHSRAPFRGSMAESPATAQALARLGGQPAAVLAVPLILRDKLAAVLYCDTSQPEIPGPEGDLIEIVVQYAAKSIDLLSFAPRPAAAAPRPAPAAPAPAPAHAAPPAPAPRPPAPAPAPPPPAPRAPAPPAAPADEGSSTVMFSAQQFAQIRQQVAAGVAPPAAAPAPPPAPAGPPIPPEHQKAHDDAKRFARLVVSEIKLYNEAKVNEGRKNKDIYDRLKEDIERGRQTFNERVPAHVRDHTDYFKQELVRILGGGDASALGH